jgi:flagellar FliL protein
MATQAIEQVPTADGAAEAAPAKAGKKKLIIMAVAGLLAGAAAGLFGVGPILAKKKAATPAPKHEEAAPAAPITHEFQNIVLNPAGSNGQRFLMVSAAFELKDGGVEQLMKDREAEVRDRLLALLGQKEIDVLTDYTQRDSIKKEVLDAISPLFPKGGVLKVFFPQFVIQ